jgi:hypothetical protein
MPAITATQATTVTSATSNIKNDSIIMTAHNSRKARKAGMIATTEPPTQYGPAKARMPAQTEPATAGREANSSKNNWNR